MPQFNVTTEAVQAAGQKIQALSEEIENLIGQLQQTALSVHGEWTGQANSAFENAMTEWRSAAMNIRQAANQIGQATLRAGSNYAETETSITSMYG